MNEEDYEEEYEMERVELTSEGNINTNENEQNDIEDNNVVNAKDKEELINNNYNNNIEISPGDTFYISNKLNLQQNQSNNSFYPKNSSLNGTISSNQSVLINQKQIMKAAQQLSENHYCNEEHIEQLHHNKMITEYNQLLADYKKVSKEKDDVLLSLKNEILINEQQRTYIALQKSMMNEMIASQKQTIIQNNNNSYRNSNKGNKPSKQSSDQLNPKEDYSELVMGIPIIRNQLKDSESKVTQLSSVIESMAQRELELMSSLEQEAKSKLAALENNKNLNDELNKLNNTLEQYQVKENENIFLTNQLAKYKTITIEKNQLQKDLEKEIGINQSNSNKLTQLATDIEKKNSLIKEIEKEIVILTINEKNTLSNITKLTSDNALLSTNNRSLKEKESELNKTITELNEQIKALNKEMAKAIKDNSSLRDQKDLTINENIAVYNELKSRFDILQNESNNQLIVISDLKEKNDVFMNQIKKDKETIETMSKQIKDNEIILSETKAKLEIITTAYDKLQLEYKDNVTKLKLSNSELYQIDKDNTIKYNEEMSKKEKEIFILKTQIENPKQYANIKYYNPRLAIQSCLIASNHLLENAHSFYSKKDYHIFLESVDELRRELAISFNALSNDDETRALTIQIEKCTKELSSYKSDNKKLFDHCKELKLELNTRKEYIELCKELINRIMDYHIANKSSKESINNLLLVSSDLIELMREYDRLEQRNCLLYKRNEEVFNLYNDRQGQYNDLGIKEQQVIFEYNNTNEIKERLKIDINKAILQKENLNKKLYAIENNVQS